MSSLLWGVITVSQEADSLWQSGRVCSVGGVSGSVLERRYWSKHFLSACSARTAPALQTTTTHQNYFLRFLQNILLSR